MRRLALLFEGLKFLVKYRGWRKLKKGDVYLGALWGVREIGFMVWAMASCSGFGAYGGGAAFRKKCREGCDASDLRMCALSDPNMEG